MKFLYVFLFINFIFSQNTISGIPKSFDQSTVNLLAPIIMPEVDVDKLLLEDENAVPGTPFRYGKIFDVDYSLNNSGTWEVLDDGSKLWRLEIHSKGAFSIGIEYD